jgi:hypothetical protein
MRGVVFETRQGYKSKDSKRQNADLTNAASAYTNGYIPILAVLSTQIDNDIIQRYERNKWLVMTGTISGDAVSSTYAFMRDVIGYDLQGFFVRNSERLKSFTQNILENLLRPDNDV